MVMYAGQLVETGPVDEIFYTPRIRTRWACSRSLPRLDAPQRPTSGMPPHQGPAAVAASSCRPGARSIHAARTPARWNCEHREPSLELIEPAATHSACLRRDEIAGGVPA